MNLDCEHGKNFAADCMSKHSIDPAADITNRISRPPPSIDIALSLSWPRSLQTAQACSSSAGPSRRKTANRLIFFGARLALVQEIESSPIW